MVAETHHGDAITIMAITVIRALYNHTHHSDESHICNSSFKTFTASNYC